MLHRAALCRSDGRLFWTVCAPTVSGLVFASLTTRTIVLQLPYCEIRALSLDSKSKLLLRVSLLQGATLLFWCDTAELLTEETIARSKTDEGNSPLDTDEEGAIFSCSISSGTRILHPAVITVKGKQISIHTSDVLMEYALTKIVNVSILEHPCILCIQLAEKQLILEFCKVDDASRCYTCLSGYILLSMLDVDSKKWVAQFYINPKIRTALLSPGSTL